MSPPITDIICDHVLSIFRATHHSQRHDVLGPMYLKDETVAMVSSALPTIGRRRSIFKGIVLELLNIFPTWPIYKCESWGLCEWQKAQFSTILSTYYFIRFVQPYRGSDNVMRPCRDGVSGEI